MNKTDTAELMKTIMTAIESNLPLREMGITLTILMSVPGPDGSQVNYISSGKREDMIKALAQVHARLSPRVQHIARGSSYGVLGEASVQTSRPLEDTQLVSVYRSLDDDALYVRPIAEMNDGRFKEV